MVSFQAQDVSQLSRKERLDIRNQIIMGQIYSGINKDVVSKQFRISTIQLNRIIKDIEKENQEWYQNLPKTGMASMFRLNECICRNYYTQVKELFNDRIFG